MVHGHVDNYKGNSNAAVSLQLCFTDTGDSYKENGKTVPSSQCGSWTLLLSKEQSRCSIITIVVHGHCSYSCKENSNTAVSSRFVPLMLSHFFTSLYLSLNLGGRWCTTDDFTTSFLHLFSVLHCPLGLCELRACPFPDVVFPPLFLSALSSSPFHCALQDGFGQT